MEENDRKEKGGFKKHILAEFSTNRGGPSSPKYYFPQYVFCQNKFFSTLPIYFIPKNILLINIPLESCEKSQSLILM